jgi:hypothetical protein
MQRQFQHWVVPVLAWARLELGEVSEAAELLRQVVGYARDAGDVFLLAEVLWLQDRVTMRQGRWDDAATALSSFA